ncbi:C-terminal processing protease CtpA/Prc, contains a PDZ domain [Chryseobacterium wanjuense]|uniref:C-terminal processing protease CtpA/Prc, contains a PDZ domain n=1 Tax=Chryseobacterium wanjuense TaxID=356305 RepID=A0A1I0N1Q6_9FLAO|nr:S41 family peptidase [Chryseobacterium wanjuense]SEV94962.1 C-terminal processing protease CtpA/Prc, contains a PDZ domain [Chryseobacterium wanjuense]
MRKFSIFIILFFSLHFSAQALSETQKLESLCKVWGFLKYYHPNVAKGNFNWDQQLFQKISELENINDKNQLNELYSNWLESLGKVDECKECLKEDNKIFFLKNFDLNWINNQEIFTPNVIQKLQFIQNNRNLGENHYFGKGGRKVYFRNENSYGSKFTSKQISLFELFRYWNYVEYFFPYKYGTDQNWNDVLTEMIPKFVAITNDENYQLTLAELVTKIDDSHAFLFSRLISLNQYGRKSIPVEYSYAEGKLVITKINSTTFNEENPLKVGDIIYDINGLTIPQKVNAFGKYIPASNSWGKIKKAKNLFLMTNGDSIQLKIERDGKNLALQLKTFLLKDIISEKPTQPEKWKFIDDEKKIGYVNMGVIEKTDLDEMYNTLKSTGSIIFDLRNYPKQTILPLSRMLLPKNTIYYQFNFPDTNYLSKFYSRKNSIGRNNPDYYKGNVVVLVNENTQSQAETTTMMFKQHPKAKVIGSNTAGANGDIIRFNIADLETCFTGLGAYYPDGKETQRIGIIPDIMIKPSVKGIREGRDEVLERALDYIKNGH